MLEVLISEVFERKKKLFLTFKDVGSVYVNWEHVFPTKILSQKEENKLKKIITNDPELNKYPLTQGCKIKNYQGQNIFRILHYKAPITILEKLKQETGEKFISGHYTERARERFANPGTAAIIQDWLARSLELRREYNNLTQETVELIKQYFPERKQAYHTRLFNELKKSIQDNKENTFSKKLSSEIKKNGEKLEHLQYSINLNCETNLGKEGLDIILKDIEPVIPMRPLNSEEVLRQKWLFMDIEIPRFRKNNEISWVGMRYTNSKNEIHTLSNLDTEEYKKFKIYNYEIEQDLIEGVKNSILKENPDYVSAYNAKFDLLKMRENSDFRIGERETPPLQEVSTDFFERVNIRGRTVIDLLRWAQFCFDYLPNKKLELVSKTLLGDKKFEKEITYDEMEVLEDRARFHKDKKERVNASKKIASYLVNDVNVMLDIFKSDEFTNFLELATETSKEFHIPLPWSFYSPRSINLAQERSYFKSLGIYRNEVYYKSKNARDEVSQGKQDFRKLLNNAFNITTNSGVYENVHVAYLRYGHFFKEIIGRRFPDSKKLFSKKSKNNFEHFILGRWGNAIAEWLTADYAILKKREKKLKMLVKKHNIIDIYSLYKSQVSKLSKWAGVNFNKGTLTSEGLEKHLCNESEKLLKQGLGIEDILYLLNTKRKAKKFSGRLYGNYQTSKKEIELELLRMAKSTKQFAEHNNLKLIHQEGQYIYFSGDVEEVKKKYPKMFLFDIPKVLVTNDVKGKNQKIYYETHGFYHGMKLLEHPTNNLNKFEMETHGEFVKEVLKGNNLNALEKIYLQSDLLMSEKVDNEDLVWHSKASNRFSAFEDGEKIYFRNSTTKKEREHTIETINGKDKKVYSMNIEDLNPDWNLYNEKNSLKVNNLLHCLIGSETNRFLSKIEENGLITDEELEVMAEKF